MHNFGFSFLWTLAACTLWNRSFAEDQSGYICLIEDPKQNQCDSICLTELSPRLNKVAGAQIQGNTNTRKSVNEIKSKLERLEVKIEGVQAKLEGRLEGVESKLVGQLQGVEKKLEGQLQEVQTKLEAKLGESLLAVQKKIENQLHALANQLQLVSNKIDAAEVKSQLQAIANKTSSAPQQSDKVAVPALPTITTPSGFELIGTRYFRIINERADWETAERRCREMGGYLASFRNDEEMNAIKPKLGNYYYWLGINDHDNEGHFVSVASHKPAPFLKWGEQQPTDTKHVHNCVVLFKGKMWDFPCSADFYFICQADNET